MEKKVNKIKILILISLIICIIPVKTIYSEDRPLLAQKLTSQENSTKKRKRKNKKKEQEKTINFSYENEDLVDIINYLAQQKAVNVIFPQGANAINVKVTLTLEEKVTLSEAWNFLITLLDISGYTLMPKGDMYTIVKNSQNISKEPLQLYINVSNDKLPDSDKRIRYIYYFSNIKAPATEDESSELIAILKNCLPTTTSSFKTDPVTNAVIISAKSNDIRAVMKIIRELDKIEFQETLEIIRLRFATARIVAELFNENILKTTTEFNRYRLDARAQTEANFFSKYIKMFPEDRTNTLIVLGRPRAIDRVKDFISKYIDIELESGKSILHIKQLQYVDAVQMARVLTSIVQSAQTGGTEQARAGAPTTLGGITKFFDEVIIRADKPESGGEEMRYFGGNKLVVAARNDDWKVIERLIEELDIPQPQVLLEILVADLTLEDVKQLGALTRNPAKISLMGDTNFQAAEIGQVILDFSPPNNPANPTTIKSDLLNKQFDPNGTYDVAGGTVSVAQVLSNGAPGSSFISLNDNDGKTWSLIQILKTLSSTKILSHPHVITTNNQAATVTIGQERLLQDESVPGGVGSTTIKFKKIQANLKVVVTPRISAANTVYLDVDLSVNNFASANINTMLTRKVKTNALVKDKDILALGGLIELDVTQGTNETPLLSRIPIIGYFFKSNSSDDLRTNLTIFISPTIIEPRLRSGVSDYTKSYINLGKAYTREGGLFEGLRDPVTRWFFNTTTDAEEILDSFLAKDEFKADLRRKNNTNRHVMTSKETSPEEAIKKAIDHKPSKEEHIERGIKKTNKAIKRTDEASQKLAALIAQDEKAQELAKLIANDDKPLLLNT
jgi:general secretion pathway protein D